MVNVELHMAFNIDSIQQGINPLMDLNPVKAFIRSFVEQSENPEQGQTEMVESIDALARAVSDLLAGRETSIRFDPVRRTPSMQALLAAIRLPKGITFAKGTSLNDGIAAELFRKAVDKAQDDADYRALLAAAIERPDTCEVRELFSHWGSWLEDERQPEAPHYPYREAVNRISEVFCHCRALADADMSGTMLDDAYNQDGSTDYPVPGMRRHDWVQAAYAEETDMGYWDWVAHRLRHYEHDNR